MCHCHCHCHDAVLLSPSSPSMPKSIQRAWARLTFCFLFNLTLSHSLQILHPTATTPSPPPTPHLRTISASHMHNLIYCSTHVRLTHTPSAVVNAQHVNCNTTHHRHMMRLTQIISLSTFFLRTSLTACPPPKFAFRIAYPFHLFPSCHPFRTT